MGVIPDERSWERISRAVRAVEGGRPPAAMAVPGAPQGARVFPAIIRGSRLWDAATMSVVGSPTETTVRQFSWAAAQIGADSGEWSEIDGGPTSTVEEDDYGSPAYGGDRLEDVQDGTIVAMSSSVDDDGEVHAWFASSPPGVRHFYVTGSTEFAANRCDYDLEAVDDETFTVEGARNTIERSNTADLAGPSYDLTTLPPSWEWLPIGKTLGGTDIQCIVAAFEADLDGETRWWFSATNVVDGPCGEEDLFLAYAAFGEKGEIFVGTADGDAEPMAAGADGTVLTADSAESTGLRFDWRHRLLDGPLTADGSSLTNTTSETDLNLAVVDIGAALNAAGATVRIVVTGSLAVTGTPTITFRLKWNSTTLLALGAVTAAAGGFSVEFLVTCKTTGASGVLRTSALSGFAVARTISIPAPTETTVDLTDSAADIKLSGQWSAASTSNICTVTTVVATALNL